MRLTSCLLPLVLALAGCAAAPVTEIASSVDAVQAGSTPDEAPAPPAEPEWLVRDRAREATLEGQYDVEAADGWFRARVPARPVPRVVAFEEDAHYAFDFDLASDVSITCRVMRAASDPPELLQSASENLFEGIDRSVGPVLSRQIDGITVGPIGPAPFMGIDWLFLARTEEGDVTGGLGLRYAVKDDAGILCMKIGIGFAETLRAIVGSLVETFVRVDPPPPATFEEIMVASVGGRRIGIGHRAVRRDVEGDMKDEITLDVLMPTAPDRTVAISSYRYEWVDGRDLRLLNAGMVAFEDGVETMNLVLEPAEGDRAFRIHGRRAGEAVERLLPRDREVTSDLAAIEEMRATLTTRDPLAEPLTSWVWSDADPLAISESTTRFTQLVDADRARAVATVGRNVVEVVVERPTGQTISATYRIDGTPIEVERVFARGRP